jgi:pimeloyl-ACP methyl ester carboxylesterase
MGPVGATSQVEELDLELESGRLHAQRFGPPNAPMTLCVHGLSAHTHGFDYLAPRLVAAHRQLVVPDLRGRGRSEITPPGTYGPDAHIRDVLDVATLLGAEQFDLIGWSMGALIGIGVATQAPHRLRRLVLIDHAGHVDRAALAVVERGLARLDAVVEKPEDYVEAIRAAGNIAPWSEFWDRYFRYELAPDGDRLRPTTSKAACLEDLGEMGRPDWHSAWQAVTMPALLVRCLQPIGGGFVVPEHERDALLRAVQHLMLVEVESNHYTVMTDEHAAKAIRELLERPA